MGVAWLVHIKAKVGNDPPAGQEGQHEKEITPSPSVLFVLLTMNYTSVGFLIAKLAVPRFSFPSFSNEAIICSHYSIVKLIFFCYYRCCVAKAMLCSFLLIANVIGQLEFVTFSEEFTTTLSSSA